MLFYDRLALTSVFASSSNKFFFDFKADAVFDGSLYHGIHLHISYHEEKQIYFFHVYISG